MLGCNANSQDTSTDRRPKVARSICRRLQACYTWMALPVVTHPVRCLPTETKTARPLTIINSAFKRSSQLSWAAFFEVPFEKRPSFASSLETCNDEMGSMLTGDRDA